MQDTELEDLEGALDAVSQDLAATADWDHVSRGMRRQLRQPDWNLVWIAGIALLLGLWGLHETRAGLAALVLLAFLVPGEWRRARDRRRRLARNDRELFTDVAREIHQRFQHELVHLLLLPMAVLALLVLASAVPEPAWPLALAALLALYMPWLFLVRIVGTKEERREADRWLGIEEDDSLDDEDDDEDEDDENGLLLLLEILVRMAGVFVLYLGPPLVLVLLVLAARLEDSTPPLITAGVLVVAWILVWIFVVHDDVEEDA